MNTPTVAEEKKNLNTSGEQISSSTDANKTNEIQKEKKDEIAKNLTDDQRLDLDIEKEIEKKYGKTKGELISNLQKFQPKKYQDKSEDEILKILKKDEPYLAIRLEGYIKQKPLAQKKLEEEYDVNDRIDEKQLGGFDMKTYQKILKEKGAKAAAEYANVNKDKKETPKSTQKTTNNMIKHEYENFDVNDRIDEKQLGGFDMKTYQKILKEKGAKAAAEYANVNKEKKEKPKIVTEKKPEEEKPEPKKEDNNKKRWNPRTRFKNKGGNEGKKEDRTNHMLRKIISPITAPLAFLGGGMLKALAKVESTIARPQDIFTKTYWTEFWKQEKDHGKTRGPSSEKGKWYKVPTWFLGKNRKVPAHFRKTVLHAAHETLTGLWKWKFKYTATKESWKKLTSWNYKKEASK